MIDEFIAEIADVRHDHIQQAFRNSRFFKNSGDQRSSGDCRIVVRLQHHAVTRADGRRHRAHAQEKWKVEGADNADYANGNAIQPVLLALDRRRNDFADHPQRIRGCFLDDVLDDGNLEERFESRAAQLLDDNVRDLGFIFFDERESLLQYRTLFVRVHPFPDFLRGRRGTVGLIEIGKIRQLELADRILIIGIPVGQDLACVAISPGAANVLLIQRCE